MTAALAVSAFALLASPARAAPDAAAAVLARVGEYRAALEARSVERMAPLVAPDLLVLEGTHPNRGWADFRDNHIGPEMREWKELSVLARRTLAAHVAGATAWVVEEASYRIVTPAGTVVLDAAETFVLRRHRSGWLIAHIHMSGKRRGAVPPAPGPTPAP